MNGKAIGELYHCSIIGEFSLVSTIYIYLFILCYCQVHKCIFAHLESDYTLIATYRLLQATWPCKLDLHYFVWSVVVQMEMVTDQVQLGNGLCQDSSSCCQPWHFRACCPSLLNCLPGYSGVWPAEQQSLAVISPWEWLAPECSVLRTPLEHYGVCFMGVMYF